MAYSLTTAAISISENAAPSISCSGLASSRSANGMNTSSVQSNAAPAPASGKASGAAASSSSSSSLSSASSSSSSPSSSPSDSRISSTLASAISTERSMPYATLLSSSSFSSASSSGTSSALSRDSTSRKSSARFANSALMRSAVSASFGLPIFSSSAANAILLRCDASKSSLKYFPLSGASRNSFLKFSTHFSAPPRS